jgi:hypothetical protein
MFSLMEGFTGSALPSGNDIVGSEIRLKIKVHLGYFSRFSISRDLSTMLEIRRYHFHS